MRLEACTCRGRDRVVCRADEFVHALPFDAHLDWFAPRGWLCDAHDRVIWKGADA